MKKLKFGVALTYVATISLVWLRLHYLDAEALQYIEAAIGFAALFGMLFHALSPLIQLRERLDTLVETLRTAKRN